MKPYYLALLAFCALVGCGRREETTAAAPHFVPAPVPVVKAPEAGRFQLVQGETEIEDFGALPPEARRRKVIFKIDTQTGQTWIYVDSYNPNTKEVRIFWFEIKDDSLRSQ